MQPNKTKAIELRNQKKSYNEISLMLSIPKSTLNYWFKNSKTSKKIKEELLKKNRKLSAMRIKAMNAANRNKWEQWRKNYRQEALDEYASLKNNPLFVGAINQYWGEGDSVAKNGIVRLANSDYRMIKIFNIFLRKICRIPEEKIKLCLFLYADLDLDKCKKFWSRKTNIALTQFSKPQIIKGRHPTRRLEHGIGSIQVYSRGLKEKIIVWIDLFAILDLSEKM